MSTAQHTITESMPCLLGVETALGTEAAATIRFGSMNLTPSPKQETKKLKPQGQLLPKSVLKYSEGITIAGEGDATYEDLAVFLSDITTNAAAANIPSFSIGCGGIKALGCVQTGWSIEDDASGVKFKNALTGMTWALGNLTGTPSQNADTLIERGHVTLKWGSNVFADKTHLNVFKWALAVANLWGENRHVGSNEVSTFSQRVQDDTYTLDVEKNTTTDALISDRTVKTANIVIQAGTAVGSKRITITFDCQLDTVGEFKDNDGIYGYQLKYAIVNKTSGASISITHDTVPES